MKKNISKERAVFLDRDGVINAMYYDQDHGIMDSPLNPDQFELLPRVGEAISLLRSEGFACIVVSNQPTVAKGKTTISLLEKITKKMNTQLAEANAELDDVYYCLHHPEASVDKYRVECDCRKPKPGLLIQASREHQIELERSYMVGDGLNDIQAGERAGCKTIFLGKRKCYKCKRMQSLNIEPNFIVNNLYRAAKIIIGQEGGKN